MKTANSNIMKQWMKVNSHQIIRTIIDYRIDIIFYNNQWYHISNNNKHAYRMQLESW